MMSKLIQWDEIYCFQKFLPLLTRWQLQNGNDSNILAQRGHVQPDFIKKKRTPKGVPSYEIIWKDEHGCFDMLIPDNQMQVFYTTNKEKSETEAIQLLWTTIEPIDLVEKVYPDLVNRFEESKTKGKSKKTKTSQATKKAKTVTVNSTEDQNIIEKAPKQVKSCAGAKIKKNKDENVRPIDHFFRKKTEKSSTVYSSPKIRTTTKPMNLSAFSINIDDSYMVENDDMNLSAIIHEMLARPPNLTEFNGKKLKFDEITLKSKTNHLEDIVNDEKNAKLELLQRTKAEESMDEFDLIVMGKIRKSIIGLRNSGLESPVTAVKPNDCSTPLTRYHAKNESMRPNFAMNRSLKYDLLENRKNPIISSSFFSVNPDDDIDLFEKSIDYRNMKDVDSDSDCETNESQSSHETSKESKASHVIDEDIDEFDRLVGLDCKT